MSKSPRKPIKETEPLPEDPTLIDEELRRQQREKTDEELLRKLRSMREYDPDT